MYKIPRSLRNQNYRCNTYEEWIIDKEPSCTDTGSKHKYCSECGDTITEEIPKLEQKKKLYVILYMKNIL